LAVVALVLAVELTALTALVVCFHQLQPVAAVAEHQAVAMVLLADQAVVDHVVVLVVVEQQIKGLLAQHQARIQAAAVAVAVL
jgi:hypothetical protein